MIAFIVSIIVLFTLFRFGAFLVSNHMAGELNEIREKTGGLTLPVLRGMATAMMADLIVLPSFLLALLPERETNGTGTPVVLVHGLFHNRSAWLFMERRLRRAGFTNLHTYQYNSFTKDFEPAVHGLLRKLDRVLAANPDGKVILIGHSLGGLVSRCAAGNRQYRDRIAGLVTLGSPHKGSDLAWFGGNRMARDLIPGRHIAQSVERMPDPECPRFGIYTLTDDYVFPLSMLRTGRPGWEERICSPMGHVWMLYSREVAGTVIQFLNQKVAK